MDSPIALPPPPRVVRATTSRGCGWILILPFVAVGIALVASATARVWVQHAGTDVTATVDSVTSTYGRRGGSQHAVHFHYDRPSGRVDDSQDASAVEVGRLTAGSKVPGKAGRFLGWPVCVLQLDSAHATTVVSWLVATVWDGLVGAALVAMVVSPRRRRRLVETGTAVAGEVTSAYRARRSSSVLTVGYRFPGPVGPIVGKQLVTDRGVSVTVGQAVTVVYDPARPRRNVVYDWSGYAAPQ